MAVPAFPTLDQTTFLTSPQDIIAKIIQFYCYAPKSISELFHDETISLIETISRFGDNKQAIAGPIESELTPVLERYFGRGASIVEVTYEDVDVVQYNLVIRVTVIVDGVPITASNSLVVNTNGDITIRQKTGQ